MDEIEGRCDRWVGIGLLIGLIVALNPGGSAVIKHYALRLILWLKGYTSFHFIKFLDHCAKLILLKKVDAGYIFIHRMLLEYWPTSLHRLCRTIPLQIGVILLEIVRKPTSTDRRL